MSECFWTLPMRDHTRVNDHDQTSTSSFLPLNPLASSLMFSRRNEA